MSMLLGLLRESARARPTGRALSISKTTRIEEAERHGLSAWILGRVSSDAAGQLYPEWRNSALATAAGHLRLRRALHRLLERFEKDGISAVLLKGLAFAARYYPEAAQRPASDLDVLVSSDEVPRARAALLGLGYRELEDTGTDHGGVDSHHHAFSGPDGLVELHFRAFHGFGSSTLEFETLAPRMVEGAWEGHPVRYLGPEDEFVYMSVHAANHLFARLSWLLDLELMRQQHCDFDWERINALVEGAQLANAMTLAWCLGETVFGWEPLPAVTQSWSSSATRGRQIARLLTSGNQLVSGRLSRSRVPAFMLRALLAEAVSDTALHLKRGAFRLARRQTASLRRRPHSG